MEIGEMVPVVVAFAAVAVVIVLYVRIAMRMRRGGGSITTVASGAYYEFLTRDRRKATETIVDMNAGKNRQDPRKKESN